jgi:hypothetical protein
MFPKGVAILQRELTELRQIYQALQQHTQAQQPFND